MKKKGKKMKKCERCKIAREYLIITVKDWIAGELKDDEVKIGLACIVQFLDGHGETPIEAYSAVKKIITKAANVANMINTVGKYEA